MLNPERAIITTNNDQNLHDHHQRDHEEDDDQEPVIRDIHALTPPQPPPPRARRREAWETGSHRSSSLSISSEVASTSTENFTTMSREFNALVLAGSAIDTNNDVNDFNNNNNNNTVNGNNNYNSNVNYNNNSLLARIREDHHEVPEEETNPLAIVPDNNPYDLGGSESRRVRLGGDHSGGVSGGSSGGGDEICVERVKKEEVESKISAWQNAKVSKINNRYKREEAVINGWENEQVQKAGSWMKKVERKLEEKRARALEKMQNDVAKARRKAEDKRSSAEAKRGTKIAGILEIANLMRAVGRPPAKRSFFK